MGGAGGGESTSRERLRGLREVSALLAPLRSPAEVARIIVGEGAAAIGSRSGSLCLLLPDGATFELVEEVGYAKEITESWQRFPLAAPLPAGDAVRSGRIVTMTSLADRDAKYPVFAGTPTDSEAYAVIPLQTEAGEAVGVLTLGWPDAREFDEEDLEFLETLGALSAQAVERSRLYEATRAANQRLRFLADASRELGASLDPAVTLARVVDLAVPAIADTASLHLLRDERLELVALRHRDPDGEAAMRTLSTRTNDIVLEPLMLHVATSGETTVFPEVPRELWEPMAEDPEHAGLLLALDTHSGVIVALRHEGRVLGTLAMTMTSASGRSFSDDDLPFVEDVAARAAVGLANAMAHADRVEMATTLQQSLLPPALPLIDGLDLAVLYRGVGDGGVGGDLYDAFPLADNRWGVLIGDVAGKGVDAAALTAHIRYTVRAVATDNPEPSAVLARVNRSVIEAHLGERFATLIFGVIETNPDGVHVAFASGGHPLPLLRQASGTVREVGEGGTAVGLFEQAEWTTTQIQLAPGDALVAYTDGVLEARSPAGAFAPYLLSRTLGMTAGATAHDIVREVGAAVDSFQEGLLRDDLCILAMQVPSLNALVEVRLLDLPPALVAASFEWMDDLRRELDLIRRDAPASAEVAYPQRLLAILGALQDRMPESSDPIRRAAEAALAHGKTTFDGTLPVPAGVAPVLTEFGQLLTDIDAFAAGGALLTLARSREVERYLTWVLEELSRQMASGPPKPWPYGDDAPGEIGSVRPTQNRNAGLIGADSERLGVISLAPHPSAPRAARAWLRALATDWDEPDFDDLELPVVELVTNAVLHATGPAGDGNDIVVRVGGDARRFRVEVEDGSSVHPETHPRTEEAGTGRGLMLVDALVDAWGVISTERGKTVWFERELPAR